MSESTNTDTSKDMFKMLHELLANLQAYDKSLEADQQKVLANENIQRLVQQMMSELSQVRSRQNVSTVFASLLKEINQAMKDHHHRHPVDMEINYNNVDIDVKKGFLFISRKKHQENMMSIKLATRILPEN